MKKGLTLTIILIMTMIFINSREKSQPLKIGDKAPHFTLISDSNKKVSLNEFKGQKVVLYFFPKADTPG